MLAHRPLLLPKEEGQGTCLLPKRFTGRVLQHVGRKRRGEGREKKPGLGGRAELLRNSAQRAGPGWTAAGAELRSLTQQMVKEL